MLIIGSPMCTAFSQLQHINFAKMSPEDVNQVIEYGTRHLEYCADLYKMQMDNGLYFLHEHPWGASSWKNEKIMKLLNNPKVQRIRGDMCEFGMSQCDELGEALIKKPTGFMIE